MEVITWQLGIIISVVICQIFAPRAVIWLCIVWAIFTLTALFYFPLIVIQLISIWAPLFLLQRLTKQNHKISELSSIINDLKGLTPETRRAVLNTPDEQCHCIHDRDHLTFMKEQIETVSDKIIILSGWVSDKVIDNGFVAILNQKLQAECKVFIGYGWEDSQGRHETWKTSEQALKMLDGLMNSYKKNFHIA